MCLIIKLPIHKNNIPVNFGTVIFMSLAVSRALQPSPPLWNNFHNPSPHLLMLIKFIQGPSESSTSDSYQITIVEPKEIGLLIISGISFALYVYYSVTQ